MANPTPYVPGYSYVGWQTLNPAKPLPASQVGNDFASIAASLSATITALADVRRSDGKLANGSVTIDSLNDATFGNLGAALTGTAANAASASASATAAAASAVVASNAAVNASAGRLAIAANLSDLASVSTARTNLGATALGTTLFTLATAGAGRTALGSTTVGDALFITASASAARTTLGSTTVGDAVFVAASAAAARTSLGTVIGTDVQAYDAELAAIAALATNGIIAKTGAGTVATRTITNGSGVTVANGDGVAGNPVIAADLADAAAITAATAGKVVDASVFTANKIVRATAVASTSGTSIDFTGIPSWAKRVTIMFSGTSTTGTSPPLIQIGNGAVVTTGYVANSSSVSGGGNTTSTAGFPIRSLLAANAISGALTLLNITGNQWVACPAVGLGGDAAFGGGAITLAGVMDRVRITTVGGTDTFDAGTVNVMWE